MSSFRGIGWEFRMPHRVIRAQHFLPVGKRSRAVALPQKRRDTPADLAQRDWLRDFVRWAKGDPKLDAWEAGFIHSIGQYADISDGPLPSAKQATIVQRIATKLGYDRDAEPNSLSDRDATDDDDGVETG
jgi:hypothetical protein